MATGLGFLFLMFLKNGEGGISLRWEERLPASESRREGELHKGEIRSVQRGEEYRLCELEAKSSAEGRQ